MHHRLAAIGITLILLLSLGLTQPHAQTVPAIQLCGFTQFADFVIIGATEFAGSRLLLASLWVQIVPHLYTLQGSGSFVRDPLSHTVFPGGLAIVNPSNQFGNNPLCAVEALLINVTVDPLVPLFAGTAKLTCGLGPSGPFETNLELNLSTCDEPGFPGGGEVNIAARPSAQLEEPLGREARGPAGSAPNEYDRR